MDRAFINIPSSIEDVNYRYKMPKMQLKIEGKGNGIKTNIVNMQDVSKSLRVPTEYPLKFMGYEYGSLIIFKEKGNDVTTIINGAFKEEQLQKTLDKFIEKYVLCPKCLYPELVLRVKQNTVTGKCDSCGERTKCDNSHKLASYIVKNPPKPRGINKEEQKQKEEIVAVDNKKETKKEKKVEDKDQTKNIKKIEATDLLLESENLQKKVEMLTECIKLQRNQEGDIIDIEIALANIIKEIKDFYFNRGLESQTAYIIFQSVFTFDIAHEINANANLLSMLHAKLKIQKSDEDILMNLQYFLYKTHQAQDFSQFIPTILKLLYDNNLIQEETILKWSDDQLDIKEHFLYNEGFNNRFKTDADAIVQWLKNADIDSEEEGQVQE